MIQKLDFDSDERGVSEVMGAILVFGILVVLLGIIQTQAVPAQNQEVEVKHTLDVQGDLIKFQQTTSEVAADGNERSLAFESGTGYPSRLLFFNPPRVQGTVETTEQEEVIIDNVEADNNEVNDYFLDPDGSSSNTLALDTRRLQYRVNYNELRNEPVSRYEYGLLYNYFEGEDEYIVQNNGNVIDGTTVNLRFLAGDYSKSSSSEQSLNVQPVSAPARSVRVTGTSSNNIVITLPTDLDISVWQNQYGGATNVVGITPGSGDTIEIELDGSKTYNLRMSKLALETGVTEPDPYYIVPARDGVTNAAPSQTASIEYEVRDEFNNPVADAEVVVEDANGNQVASGTTDDQGQFSTTVTTAQNQRFTAELDGAAANAAGCPGSDRCNAEFLVQVPALNLNPSSGVVVDEATTFDPDPNTRTGTGGAIGCAAVSCKADVTFGSTTNNDVGMVSLRINHYSPDPQSHNPVTIEDPSGNTINPTIGGGTVPATGLDDVAPGQGAPTPGSGTLYEFNFDGEVHQGDYFVVTIIYDNDQRGLYFISPTA